MPKISDTLQNLLKANPKLPQPTNAGFDISDWAQLEVSEHVRDQRLFQTMGWAAAQFAAFQKVAGVFDHSRYGARLSTLAAVANSNLETHNAHARHRELLHDRSKSVHQSEVGDLPLLAALPFVTGNGQSMDLDSYVSTVVDAAESWLFDARSVPDGLSPRGDVTGMARSVRISGRLYSLRRAITDLWQQALWEDWGPVAAGGKWLWSPFDRDAAGRFFAWYQRSTEISASFGLLAGSDWARMEDADRRKCMLPKTVVSVSRLPGRGTTIDVGRSGPRNDAGRHHGSLEVLKGSYMADFLNEPFPAHGELTLEVVHRCWGVLYDLAIQLGKGRKPPKFTTDTNIREWALAVEKTLVTGALGRALDLSPATADAAVDLLSWAPRRYKGLWGAPLVPVPGTEQLAIVQSVLETGNIIRSAEIWLQGGGLKQDFSKSGFGIRYESNLRGKLREAVLANPIVKDATVAQNSIKKSAVFDEEIDILIQWGELLIVGEIKCYFFPSDPSERYNYAVNLDAAVAQANRKAKAIAGAPDIAAKALGLHRDKVSALKVVPLVIVNQEFGSGLEIDGCLVSDQRFLGLYLGSGSFSSGGAFEQSGKMTGAVVTTLYKTEEEACQRFAKSLGTPPSLVSAASRLSWTRTPFPDAVHQTIWLERQAPA